MRSGRYNEVIYEEAMALAAQVYDFGTCQRQDGSFYGHGGKKCHQGVEADPKTMSASIVKNVGATGLTGKALEKKLSGMPEADLMRIANATKDGLSMEQAERVNEAVKTLEGTKSGTKKQGGANLQDPDEARKYAEFYEQNKDKTFKPKHDVSEAEVNAVIKQLKDEKEWGKVSGALAGKGSPEEAMREEAWGPKSKEATEARGKAVLKSLMDNEFKDVLGNELPWRSGMQLDHRLAGTQGGKDDPKNWIWISTASNQVKGGLELDASKKIKAGKLSPGPEAEKYIQQGLIKKLRDNAAMSKEDVAKAKAAGATAAAEKDMRRRAMRENLPLKPKSQIESQINAAKAGELKDMMRASVREGAGGSAWVKGTRGRTGDPDTKAMKAIAKLRWGIPLTSEDEKAIGRAIGGSNDDRPNKDILNDVTNRFKPSGDGLSQDQINNILAAAS